MIRHSIARLLTARQSTRSQKSQSEVIGPSQVAVDVEVQGGRVILTGDLEESHYRDLEKKILEMPGTESVNLQERAASTSGEPA